MATSKMMRRTICAYLIKKNKKKNGWMVFCNTCKCTAPTFYVLPWLPIPFLQLICPAVTPLWCSPRFWCRSVHPPWWHYYPGCNTRHVTNIHMIKCFQERCETLPSCHISNFTHLQQFNHSLCESHHIHGDSHSIGKGKNQPNGAAKLRS